MSNETTVDQQKTDEKNVEYTDRQLQSSFENSLQISSQNEASSSSLRSDAPEFKPAVKNDDQTKTTSAEPKFDMAASSVYDLKKFQHEYFFSQLNCPQDPENGKFSCPSGLTALPDDRLLVADFNRDSIFLLDLNGNLQKIYPNFKSPKDVLYHSSRPSQGIVATQKELVAIDLETGKRVLTSKIRGFYPWNVQHIATANIYAACDPSGERILYLSKDFEEVGEFSFKGLIQQEPNQKVYPYAVSFVGSQTGFVVNQFGTSCQLNEIDAESKIIKNSTLLPSNLKPFSIYADTDGNCLVPDEFNQRLVSYDKTSKIEEYRLKSSQNPYAMTFLSDGSLCVTCRNASQPSNSGICVISEENRRSKS